ncbi:MAG: His/Gly/Thr/Pro-type tRNA ligase C-terminal domain-containing protein [Candidatus Absconditabacteria bacterium]|nr:His/Gly/Thr/Pro-type tRNA ligase C-terminal domain-containing protein [Candidatus Absconditabacteria bacterium]
MLKMSQNAFKTTKTQVSSADNLSTKYLLQGGYIRQELAGVFNYLPLGLKVLNNIKSIITKHLETLGAQEILMSSLGAKEKWEKTGRSGIDILFKVPTSESNNNYNFLNPTHEEIVTPLMSEFIKSYKDLPMAVFQTQTKFRNEKRAKSGILRGREFLMNDMYSFHTDQESLDEMYSKVIEVYKNIFRDLGIGNDTYLTYASGGAFSKYSHEFQTLTSLGEDIIHVDKDNKIALNNEIIEDPSVKEEFKENQFVEEKGSEVGNIFKLGTKFTDACDVNYVDKNGKKRRVYMGCYGIGVSRTMGIVAEKFLDEKGLIWPENIAPYDYYVIRIGDERIDEEAKKVIEKLENIGKTVIYDDRNIGFGQKAKDADLLGIPKRIIISEKTLAQGGIEYKSRNNDIYEILSIDNINNIK